MKKRWVNNIFVRFLRYSVMWSEHRQAIKHLNTLSDRQLKDIGITRGEIKQRFYGTDSET